MKKIKKSKTHKIWVITTIILLFLIIISLVYYFNFIPKQKRAKEVQNIKKEFYNSIVCEYSCPLKETKFNNQTQLLPDINCVKNCTKKFKELGKINLTKEEALTDNLLKEIDQKIKECTATSTSGNLLNNTLFFGCASTELPKIRSNYNYLN